MNASRSQQRITAKLSLLVDLIREARAISFANLCLRGSIAPSTLHAYKHLLLERYSDVTYIEGVFSVKEA